MLRRIVLLALASLVAAACATGTVRDGDVRDGPPGADAGPPYDFITELMVPGPAIPLRDVAMLTRTAHGYLFRTGQQDSRLVMTVVNGGLRFADTGTKSFKLLSTACQRKTAKQGIAAVCPVPSSISARVPLLVEVWPRLGDDYTDASALPAMFAVTVLGDKGRDVAHLGAGADFFNGYSERDLVWGGPGNDWIRSGIGNDAVNGGPGHDDIVAVEGDDSLRGGDGDDRLWSGDGDDRLSGDAGADFLLCGNGSDNATADTHDRVARSCE